MVNPDNFDALKAGTVDSVSGTPTVNVPATIYLTDESNVAETDQKTGNGVWVIDFTGINGVDDLAVADELDNTLNYDIVRLDTGAGLAEIRVYNSWVRDGTEQVRLYYGNNSANTDNQNVTGTYSSRTPFGIYHFEDSSGPLTDVSGNNRDLTLEGSPQFNQTGQIADGIDWDGVDDASTASEALSYVNNAYTITGWVNIDSGTVNDGNTDMAMGVTGDILIREQNGEWRFYHHTGGSFELVAQPSISAGEQDAWVHVAITWDGSTVRCYVNATEVGSLSTSSIQDFSQSNGSGYTVAYEKRVDGTSNKFFDGTIDEPEAWEEGFTGDEIQAYYDMSDKAGQVFFSQEAAKSEIELSLNDTLDFQETLEINGDLTGTVTLGGTGVQGADVIAYDLNDGIFLGSTTTDANGDYSFAELAPNDRYLIAVHYFDTGSSTRYADAKTERPS